MLDFGFYNMDCMEGMKEFPDKYFELAIVDPPYGGGKDDYTAQTQRFGGWFTRYFDKEKQKELKAERRGGQWASKYGNNICEWDVAPTEEYFEELFRISKNQIIWGGNYFVLPATRCFIVWRKSQIPERFTMSMCEYAWTSFNSNAKVFEHPSFGGKEERFHPTQKPVALYRWILANYAKQGDKLLDTHVGSASSLIAFEERGFDYVGFEIDGFVSLLWDDVKADNAKGARMMAEELASHAERLACEAIQVAAMALKFVDTVEKGED